MKSFPDWMQTLWNEWDIRVMALFSLALQIVLFAVGRFRKRTNLPVISLVVWFAYLTADWVAIFALGKLSDAATKTHARKVNVDPDDQLRAMWAPLLLLHLGGPDTITAYSVKDTTLWIRHLLGLLVHLSGAGYVLFCCWGGSWISIITIPMFVAGIIKYGERTWSLWFANQKKSKKSNDDEENYAVLLEKIDGIPGIKWLVVAYIWYRALKPNLENFIGKINAIGLSEISFDFDDRDDNIGIENAFKLIEAQLGFVYDEVYTKGALIYTGISFFLRAISFNCTIAVLIVFTVISKTDYSHVDVIVTYILLHAAVFLEVYALILMIFSDWAINWIVEHCERPFATHILRILARFTLNQKRWSCTVAQFNLLEFCRQESTIMDAILKPFCLKDMYRKYRCQRSVRVDTELKRMTLEGAGKILAQLDDYSKFTTRGELTLQRYEAVPDLGNVFKKSFDELIICWHLTTDMCRQCEERGSRNSRTLHQKNKAITLSNYMMYLLAKQPHMLRITAGNMIFKSVSEKIQNAVENRVNRIEQPLMGIAANFALSGSDGKRGIQDEAWNLAHILMERYSNVLWEIIGDVWMEMLCYGAAHCQVNHHVECLGQGGEWITHVWILLTVLGLTDKVYVERSNLRS